MAEHFAHNMNNYPGSLEIPESSKLPLSVTGESLRQNYAIPGFGASFFNPYPKPTKKGVSDIINHELIDLLGGTTNILIFCYLDNNMPKKFTRVEIRAAIERHVAELERTGTEKQHLPRIQTGKAAVNYWIDRLVERDSLNKEHSKPVLFWRSSRYSNPIRHSQMYTNFGGDR